MDFFCADFRYVISFSLTRHIFQVLRDSYFTESKQMESIKLKLGEQAIYLFDLNIFLMNKIQLIEDSPMLLYLQGYI